MSSKKNPAGTTTKRPSKKTTTAPKSAGASSGAKKTPKKAPARDSTAKKTPKKAPSEEVKAAKKAKREAKKAKAEAAKKAKAEARKQKAEARKQKREAKKVADAPKRAERKQKRAEARKQKRARAKAKQIEAAKKKAPPPGSVIIPSNDPIMGQNFDLRECRDMVRADGSTRRACDDKRVVVVGSVTPPEGSRRKDVLVVQAGQRYTVPDRDIRRELRTSAQFRGVSPCDDIMTRHDQGDDVPAEAYAQCVGDASEAGVRDIPPDFDITKPNHHGGFHAPGDPLGVYLPPMDEWTRRGAGTFAETYEWHHPVLGWKFAAFRTGGPREFRQGVDGFRGVVYVGEDAHVPRARIPRQTATRPIRGYVVTFEGTSFGGLEAQMRSWYASLSPENLTKPNHHGGFHAPGDPLGHYMPPIEQWGVAQAAPHVRVWVQPVYEWSFSIAPSTGRLEHPDTQVTTAGTVWMKGRELRFEGSSVRDVYHQMHDWYASLDHAQESSTERVNGRRAMGRSALGHAVDTGDYTGQQRELIALHDDRMQRALDAHPQQGLPPVATARPMKVQDTDLFGMTTRGPGRGAQRGFKFNGAEKANHHGGFHAPDDPLGVYLPPLTEWSRPRSTAPHVSDLREWRHPHGGDFVIFHATGHGYVAQAEAPAKSEFHEPEAFHRTGFPSAMSAYDALQGWYASQREKTNGVYAAEGLDVLANAIANAIQRAGIYDAPYGTTKRYRIDLGGEEPERVTVWKGEHGWVFTTDRLPHAGAFTVWYARPVDPKDDRYAPEALRDRLVTVGRVFVSRAPEAGREHYALHRDFAHLGTYPSYQAAYGHAEYAEKRNGMPASHAARPVEFAPDARFYATPPFVQGGVVYTQGGQYVYGWTEGRGGGEGPLAWTEVTVFHLRPNEVPFFRKYLRPTSHGVPGLYRHEDQHGQSWVWDRDQHEWVKENPPKGLVPGQTYFSRRPDPLRGQRVLGDDFHGLVRDRAVACDGKSAAHIVGGSVIPRSRAVRGIERAEIQAGLREPRAPRARAALPPPTQEAPRVIVTAPAAEATPVVMDVPYAEAPYAEAPYAEAPYAEAPYEEAPRFRVPMPEPTPQEAPYEEAPRFQVPTPQEAPVVIDVPYEEAPPRFQVPMPEPGFRVPTPMDFAPVEGADELSDEELARQFAEMMQQ